LKEFGVIFKIAKKLLLRAGYRLEQTAKPSDILKTIRMIQPVAVGYDLIRIGGEGDGGYLIPDDLEGVKYCFSPGVDQTADFEKSWLKLMPFHLFWPITVLTLLQQQMRYLISSENISASQMMM